MPNVRPYDLQVDLTSPVVFNGKPAEKGVKIAAIRFDCRRREVTNACEVLKIQFGDVAFHLILRLRSNQCLFLFLLVGVKMIAVGVDAGFVRTAALVRLLHQEPAALRAVA